jgi:hypothetical protein
MPFSASSTISNQAPIARTIGAGLGTEDVDCALRRVPGSSALDAIAGGGLDGHTTGADLCQRKPGPGNGLAGRAEGCNAWRGHRPVTGWSYDPGSYPLNPATPPPSAEALLPDPARTRPLLPRPNAPRSLRNRIEPPILRPPPMLPVAFWWWMTTLRLGADCDDARQEGQRGAPTAYDGVEALDVSDVPARCHPARQAMPR